jgi:hypothetical protein
MFIFSRRKQTDQSKSVCLAICLLNLALHSSDLDVSEEVIRKTKVAHNLVIGTDGLGRALSLDPDQLVKELNL